MISQNHRKLKTNHRKFSNMFVANSKNADADKNIDVEPNQKD